MIASDEGNAEVVGEFLNHQGEDVNDEDELTSQPSSWQVIRVVSFWYASCRSTPSSWLVDLNDKLSHNGRALMLASENGHLQVVRDLLKHMTVDANANDDDGFAAL